MGPNGNKDYTSIQRAIENASNGDTIDVNNGNYFEKIEIDKKITINGINNPKITWSNEDHAVKITENEVTFSGFQIVGKNDKKIKIDSDYNLIKNCHISNSNYGIFIFSANNNTIRENIIENTTNCGINLFSSDENNIIINEIKCNKNGLGFLNSNKNNILGNKIHNNYEKGMKIISSDENVFSKNNISNNNLTGISISLASNNNTIFYNNFINNSNQATDYSKNIWYNTDKKIGNFWSNYQEIYKNASSNRNIWNQPYNISKGDNKDIYPSVNLFDIKIEDQVKDLNNSDSSNIDSYFYLLFLFLAIVLTLALFYIKKRK